MTCGAAAATENTGMSDGISFIQDLAVILLSAAIGGWGARRMGMSSVVGYLFAGLLVGTPQVTLLEVTDPGRIAALSQIGLVFLMFAIGMGIRLSNLKALGIAPLMATALTAVMMLTSVRFIGGGFGLSNTESLFLAAMLMVSSSAIIGKVLDEMGLLHQRAGQLALSQTLLEDLVAIVMLTFLGSVAAYAQADAGGWGAVVSSLGQLGAFVLLFVITGLLLLPRIVRNISKEAGGELQTILITGILFGLALLTVQAGFSLALGAFLCGILVAEIPRSGSIERAFSGMRDVFSAVFFVSIGMGIDLTRTPDAALLIILGTVLALVVRVIVSAISWIAVCEDEAGAIRAALFVTPIGEFSFIIAGLGVATGALDETYQIAAVGIAFLSSLLGPVGMRFSDPIANWVGNRRSPVVGNALTNYRELWRAIGKRGGSHLLWNLLRGRLLQIAREAVWVTAILLFSRPLYSYLEREVASGPDAWEWGPVLVPWYWLAIMLLVLPALIALLRNLNAVCMIIGEYLGNQSAMFRRLGPGNVRVLRLLIFGMLVIWLVNLLPWAMIEGWVVAVTVGITVLIMLLGWRRFIRWHSQAEIELHEIFAETQSGRPRKGQQQWENAQKEWGLHLEETKLPDHFAGAGQTVAELALRKRTGAAVVGVQRQGWSLNQPGPQTHLFPGDEVFLLGTSGQIASALKILGEEQEEAARENPLRRAILESVAVPMGSPLEGRSLMQLNWPRLHAVQVAAVRRDGREVTNPGPSWALAGGDVLLLIGSEAALRTIRKELEKPEPEAVAADSE